MHPLTPKLTDLSDDDILKKINELQNHMAFAYNMAQHGMVQQIQMILEDYRIEQQARQRKLMEDLQKTIDKLDKK
jgi:hypothetical protein